MSGSPWSDPDGPTLPGGEPTTPGGPVGAPGSGEAPTWPDRPPSSPPAPPAPPWMPAAGAPRPERPAPTASWASRPADRPARRPAGVRTAIGVVLLFVAGLSAVGTVAAAWTRSQIRDEDTWAATAQALADDPAVQEAVADALAAQVIGATGVDDVISGVLPGPLGGLAEPLTGRATDLVSAAALELVTTDAFQRAWEAAVRASHGELLAALDGQGRVTAVTSQGVVLDLGSTLGQLRQLLDDRGLTFLDGIDLSGLDVQFLLIDAPGVQRLADLLDVLDVLVVVLPVVAATAAVVGLVVARRRSWAVVAGGLGGLVGAGLVWAVAGVGRDRATDEISGGVLGPAAVQVVADRVTASLGSAMGTAALVAVGVVLVGGVASVVSTRRA